MKKRRVALCATVSLAVAGLAGPAFTATAQGAPTPEKFDRFIVNYDSNAAGLTRALDVAGVDKVRNTATGGAVVKTPDKLGAAGAQKLIAKLEAAPGVSSVDVDKLWRPSAKKPNDTLYDRQWDLFERKGGMNVKPLYGSGANGAGTTVAVVDTGIVPHPDLNKNVVKGYDFIDDPVVAGDGDGRDADPNDPGDWTAPGECGPDPAESSWHGSHVAGTIAAVTNNKGGIAGIAPKANIQPLRVLGKCGGYFSDIADAVVWASGGKISGLPKNTTPADVVNMSLGGPGTCPAAFQRAIDTAVKNGTTIVVAAGNDSDDAANYSPASCDKIITVAANDREGNKAFYSNYGKKVDVTAPGGEVRDETDPPGSRTKPEDGILSSVDKGKKAQQGPTYSEFMGTSMAAPHVAGLAALLAGEKNLKPARIEKLIKKSARELKGECEGGCGAGIADAAATVKALAKR